MHQESCIFCQIALGQAPAHVIWEDDNHLAFLSIFPNTEGVTVVIPKDHYGSYAFELPDDVLANLVIAAKRVGLLLDTALETVGRTGLIFEGFGVDHVHAKLFPMHGTSDMKAWKAIESEVNEYYTSYPGYLSSHDYQRANEEDLVVLANKIRQIRLEQDAGK
jgi:diadenosine tetraphosphate (Ap4A) HIT family hydrolase